MDLKEALKERHSVRRYEERSIEEDLIKDLEAFIDKVNEESGLHIQFVKNEPKAFSGVLAHYGNFSGVTNYLAIVGKKSDDLDMKAGYYGQKIVLYAQTLGLRSCWVALTYQKVPNAFKIDPGEKLVIVISIGYGLEEGKEHRSKDATEVSNIGDDSPEWFKEGVKAALLAPTAVNQQRFKLILSDDKVRAKAGAAFNAKIDLGIVKYNFEVGSGKGHDIWL